MDQHTLYLCSELVRLLGPNAETIGNLELIGSGECSVAVPEPIAPGTPVRMTCLECPSGKRRCSECRFQARVKYTDAGPEGVTVRMEFEKRRWAPGEWRPRHLADFPVTPDAES